MTVLADAGFLDLFDRYGIAWGMLALFVLATIYILRRLLNENNGILTGYVRSTCEQQQRLANTVENMAETDAKVAAMMEREDERLKQIEETAQRIESNAYGSSIALSRCFRHGLDLLDQVSEKLEIAEKCKPMITMMRRELEEHAHTIHGVQPKQGD